MLRDALDGDSSVIDYVLFSQEYIPQEAMPRDEQPRSYSLTVVRPYFSRVYPSRGHASR